MLSVSSRHVLGAEDFPRLPLDLNLNVMACFSPMAALVLRRRNRRGSSESGNSGPLWGGVALLSTSVTAGLGRKRLWEAAAVVLGPSPWSEHLRGKGQLPPAAVWRHTCQV